MTKILLAVVIPFVAIPITLSLAGIYVNLTPSLPIGLYVADERGQFASFCPPDTDFISAVRGYRPKGSCPDGAAPLLKPVVASGTDIVELSAKGISINGSEPLPNSAPRAQDTAGRSLEHYPYGFYPYVHGRVWVVSSHNPRSFDSRYFGPIPVASIKRHLRPLFTRVDHPF
jgi:conjugative transfer signal peptidase TraF